MHQFGDGIQDFLVASAAAGGAIGNFLNMFESLVQIGKGLMLMKRIFDIEIAYLPAIADHVVFHNYLHICP